MVQNYTPDSNFASTMSVFDASPMVLTDSGKMVHIELYIPVRTQTRKFFLKIAPGIWAVPPKIKSHARETPTTPNTKNGASMLLSLNRV